MKPFLIGKLLKPHGLKGQLRIMFYTDGLNDLEAFSAFYVKDKKNLSGYSVIGVHSVLERENGFIASVEGINDRTAADGITGTELFVDEDEIPAAGKGEYYIRDLIGCEIILEGNAFAKVENLIDIAGKKMLIIKGEGVNLAIPFNNEYFGTVDIEKKSIEGRVSIRTLI